MSIRVILKNDSFINIVSRMTYNEEKIVSRNDEQPSIKKIKIFI
jgi:hypothetical protein